MNWMCLSFFMAGMAVGAMVQLMICAFRWLPSGKQRQLVRQPVSNPDELAANWESRVPALSRSTPTDALTLLRQFDEAEARGIFLSDVRKEQGYE